MTAQAPGQAVREALETQVRAAIASAGRCTAKPGTCSSCDEIVTGVLRTADVYVIAAQEQPASGAAPELAEAMRESRQYRELLTEILATFGTPAKPGTVRWTAKQVAGWRKRAGLEA